MPKAPPCPAKPTSWSLNVARTADMPTFIFVRAEYKPDERIFVFTNTTAAYYAESDRPDGLALMRPVLKMKYSPKKFTPVSK